MEFNTELQQEFEDSYNQQLNKKASKEHNELLNAFFEEEIEDKKGFLGVFAVNQNELSTIEFSYIDCGKNFGYPYISFMSESNAAAKRRAARELNVDIKKISCIDGEIFLDIENKNEHKKVLIGEYKIIDTCDKRYFIMQD